MQLGTVGTYELPRLKTRLGELHYEFPLAQEKKNAFLHYSGKCMLMFAQLGECGMRKSVPVHTRMPFLAEACLFATSHLFALLSMTHLSS